MNSFIKNTDGLNPEHKNQLPVLEKEYQPPGVDRTEITRLYADGSLYFLFVTGERTGNEKWGAHLMVKKNAIDKIRNVIEESAELSSDELTGNYKGLAIWRILYDNTINEVVTTIIPASKHIIFKEIQELINHNIVQK
ncbi:hypothetical protein [uncultured Draconibacterium sp.]|uniref:hypothetical protein n=1 Tax=uncultured Draconibacterium sp. TaxID=1573823 RepID=UPI002AA67D9C|nr:hypothetical protein [uncultured Draconibacterium sp.]